MAMSGSEPVPPARCGACHGQRLKLAWHDESRAVFNCADCGASMIVQTPPKLPEEPSSQMKDS